MRKGDIMHYCTLAIVCTASMLINGCASSDISGNIPDIIPIPKEIELQGDRLSIRDTIYYYAATDELMPLYQVLKDEMRCLYQLVLLKTGERSSADLVTSRDTLLEVEQYQLEISDQIVIRGGTYAAVAMGSVTLLQSVGNQNGELTIPKGFINDSPDMEFRGLLIDVARKKHSIEVLKQVVSLCRWYKINYLQLHLTDENYFTFPSAAYPQLPTPDFQFTRRELADLVAFADARGVELIPELEVPGHAGQFVEQMPEVFGFSDDQLNRFTIHMGRETVYPVLETLIDEIAEVFHSSSYIHTGGDEANFRGMEHDPEMQQYLKKAGLASVEELYWHFLNRMNDFVKNTGKKTIVWEGFSKKANEVVSKDITVMAWETMYQLPQDLLNAGYRIINVSWKPLYVVNGRKWSPEEIYSWNVYNWQNWYPKAPSYQGVQIAEHPDVIGAGMASWDQPEYLEISSTKLRVPAMVERIWNTSYRISFAEFDKKVQQTDTKFKRLLSPVRTEAAGLSYPEMEDGRNEQQTWFGDTLILKFSAPDDYEIHYTTTGESVSFDSPRYREPVTLHQTTTVKYRAFASGGQPIGHEILKRYELNPLKVELTGSNLISTDSLWETTEPWRIPFQDSIWIAISADRRGELRYSIESNDLNADQRIYEKPLIIKQTSLVRAGLYVNDTLVGEPWMQHFKKEMDTNQTQNRQ